MWDRPTLFPLIIGPLENQMRDVWLIADSAEPGAKSTLGHSSRSAQDIALRALVPEPIGAPKFNANNGFLAGKVGLQL